MLKIGFKLCHNAWEERFVTESCLAVVHHQTEKFCLPNMHRPAVSQRLQASPTFKENSST